MYWRIQIEKDDTVECGHVCEMITVIRGEGIPHPDWQEKEKPPRSDNTEPVLTVRLGYNKLHGGDKREITLEK